MDTFKSLRYYLVALLCCLSFTIYSQEEKPETSLLWEITGNGISQPSYLFGTMHVSKKVAFHLGDTFFMALKNSDVVALETNPAHWMKNIFDSKMMKQVMLRSAHRGSNYDNFYDEAFQLTLPDREFYASLLSKDNDFANRLLYRSTMYGDEFEFEEETYLDLFLFQAGKKLDKQIVNLENYQEMLQLLMKAYQRDEDEQKQRRNYYSNREKSPTELLLEAYRNKNLEKIDSLLELLYPSKNYRKYALHARNEIMTRSLDSLLQEQQSVFAGVGAAHLPGEKGMIELLREKGYTVRPLSSPTSQESKDLREELTHQKYPLDYQPQYSMDSTLRVKLPGKMYVVKNSDDYTQYFYPEMVNGAYYTIFQLEHFAHFRNQSLSEILSTIQDLLYENIPGDIINRDTIQLNGYRGVDVKNKSRLGNRQRYQIYVTPFHVYIFKMHGTGNFVDSIAGNKFFESIQFYPKTKESWSTYHSSKGEFTVKLPHQFQIHESPPYLSVNEEPFIQAIDTTTDQYYMVKTGVYQDYDYIEEDAFELRELTRYFGEQFDDYELAGKEMMTKRGYPAIQARLKQDEQPTIYFQIILRGPTYYLLAAQSEEKPTRFFNSFRFTTGQSPDFYTYQDTTFHYSALTSVDPFDPNYYRQMFGYGSSSKTADYKYVSKDKYFDPPQMRDKVKVEYYKFHLFSHFTNEDTFWHDQCNYLADDELYVKDCSYDKEQNTCRATLTDTNSSRTVEHKMILNEGVIYTLSVCNDTNTTLSPFVDTFFHYFRPADTSIGTSVFEDKLELFFTTLDGGDSLNKVGALNSVYYLEFKDEHAPRLIEIIQNFPFSEFDTEYKLDVIDQLGNLHHPDILPFLKEYYRNNESYLTRVEVLEAIAQQNTLESIKSFRKIFSEGAPLVPDEDKIINMFEALEDSLKLAKHLYPDLLIYTRYPEYKDEIYDLLADLVEEEYIDPTNYKKYRDIMLREAQSELRRHQAIKEQQETEESSYSYYSSGSDASSEDIQDRLRYYITLLHPYYSDAEVKDFFYQLLGATSPDIQLIASLHHLENGLSVPDSNWNWLASKDKHRAELYSNLMELDQLEKFPDQYKNQQAMSKSLLYGDDYSQPDSIRYLGKRLVTIKRGKGYAYFYKSKTEGYDDSWELDVVALQPQDTTSINIKPTIIERDIETVMPNQDTKELLDESADRLRLWERERAGSDAELSNYDYHY